MDMLGNRIIWHVVDQYGITEEEAFGLIGGDSAYSLTGRTKMSQTPPQSHSGKTPEER